MEKIERYKLKAQLFLKENTKAFIVDTLDNYHFCFILKISEDKVEVLEFSGKLNGQKNVLNWVDILRFDEFREGGR